MRDCPLGGLDWDLDFLSLSLFCAKSQPIKSPSKKVRSGISNSMPSVLKGSVLVDANQEDNASEW